MIKAVILDYNSPKLTQRCLSSLPKDVEGIVVENGEIEPPFSHIKAPCNLGFAGGCNLGIRQALLDSSVTAILLLNNDVVLPTGMLSLLEAEFCDEKVGIVGVDMVGDDGGEGSVCTYKLSKICKIPQPVKNGAFDYLQGSALLVRREVFEEIGLFDESFFFFFEDADFCLRAVKAGWKLAKAKGKIKHLGSATISKFSENKAMWYRAGAKLFLSKWATHPNLRILFPSIFRMIAGGMKVLCGTWKGLRNPQIAAYQRPRQGRRILVNTLFYIPGEIGGVETYLVNTLLEMAKLRKDVEFLIVTNIENHDLFLRKIAHFSNIFLVPSCVKCTNKIRRLWAELRLISRLSRDLNAEILWNPGNFGIKNKYLPTITTIMDMQYKHFSEDYSKIGLQIMRFFTEKAIKDSTRLLTISNFSKGEIVKYGNVSPDKIAVTHLAVSRDFEMAVCDKEETILCVANTYPHKRVEDAVVIFAKIAKDFPTLKLKIVGKPRLGEKALQKSLQKIPDEIRSRIERYMGLPQKELEQLMKAAKVFLLPSHYEGFGLPILEAQMAGVPVVACGEAATPEIGGEGAFYYKLGDLDDCEKILRRILLKGANVATAKERATTFTWENTAKATLNALLPDNLAITIVTPCFNSAKTIERLILSIDNQEKDGITFEHIIMDGGSTDETLSIIAKHTKPWRYVISEKDKGPHDAINKGFALAKGKYIAWLNADDEYAPFALQHLYKTMEMHDDASFVFGSCPIIDAENKEIRRIITIFKETFFPIHSAFLLSVLNYVSQPASLIRKESYVKAGPLDISYKAAWDYDLWLRLLKVGHAYSTKTKAPIAYFRWTPSSISGSSFKRQFAEELSIAKKHTGRFSVASILHTFVRLFIIAIYSTINRK